MNPVLLGLIGAVSWAVHDVIAARASRSVGAVRAAAIVTLAGLLILSAWLAWQGKFPSDPHNWIWLPLSAGAGIALATIWLFAALAAGSLSLALPIVMSYPVTSLALGALAGRYPSMLQLAAAAVTMGGVLAVARSEGDPAASGRDAFRRTLTFGALSHVAYAVATFAGQHSATIFDPLEATWLARVGGSLTVLPLLLRNAAGLPRVLGRWLPALVTMGGLDVLALVMINLAALTNYAEMALVAASSAGVISILLARVIFREHIAVKRWIGIFITFAGIVLLTAAQ